MDFLNNLFDAVKQSPSISEEHKKELIDIIFDLQDMEVELIGSGIMKSMSIQSKSVRLGNEFEKRYYKYGGDVGKLNECKRAELKRKEGEIKNLLPKIPNSIKRLMKVK